MATHGIVAGGVIERMVPAGTQRDGLMHVTDWFPTMVRIGSGKLGLGEGSEYSSEDGFPLDGVDAWDMIAHGAESKRTEILLNYDPTVVDSPNGTCCGYAGLRSGSYKLLINPGQPSGWYVCQDPDAPSAPPASVRAQVGSNSSQVVMLFNIDEDPVSRLLRHACGEMVGHACGDSTS